jgi:hypothetical protein
MLGSLAGSTDRLATTQQDLAYIRAWLHEWNEKLTTLPVDEREPTGEGVLVDKVWMPHMTALQTKVDAVKADTELIIDLLLDRFVILDANEVMANFLQKELLHDQYVNLEQSGHVGEADDISLAKVFVDLPASDRFGRDVVSARSRARVAISHQLSTSDQSAPPNLGRGFIVQEHVHPRERPGGVVHLLPVDG